MYQYTCINGKVKCVALTFALIGQRICRFEETCKEGNGTYSRNGYIYSSLAGYLHTSEGEDGKVIAIVLFCTSTIFHVSILMVSKMYHYQVHLKYR